MKIQIQEELLNIFPTLKVGVLVLKGINNEENSDITYQILCKTIEEIKVNKELDENDAWLIAFNAMKINLDFRPSHRSLLERVCHTTAELPNISNAVNIINKAQLIHEQPIGIHDLNKIEGDITIGFNDKSLQFTPRDTNEKQPVLKSEIVYADQKDVITRNWVWRQGSKTVTNSDTKDAIVVVDTLDLDESHIKEILQELADNFNQFLHPQSITTNILSKNQTCLDFDSLEELKKFKSINISGFRTINRDEKIINQILDKAVEEILPSKDSLKALLLSGKRIKVYQGFDPTAPTLHIGHTVMMRKLEDFRKLGHEVIMLIGDFTGRIGDPTDKGAARKKLSEKDVVENLKLYKEQANALIDINNKDNPVTVVFNNDWLGQLKFQDIVDIASEFTVQQMIKRDMFQRRLEEDKPIYLHEFLYPLMQGYDSLHMGVDIELGGNDQLFNMLAGRTFVEKRLKREKFVIAGKLLTTNEGKKMGKSEGNMITLLDNPENIFGKVMAFTDNQILPGFELLTSASMEEVEQYKRDLSTGKNPMELKKQLAHRLVSELKGKDMGDFALKHFETIFQNKEGDVKLEEVSLNLTNMNILDLLTATNIAKSKSEARRLVEQGAVYIDDKRINSWQEDVTVKNVVIRVGKKIKRLI